MARAWRMVPHNTLFRPCLQGIANEAAANTFAPHGRGTHTASHLPGWKALGPTGSSKQGWTPPKRDIYFLDIGNGVCFGFMYVVATASLGSSDNTYVYIYSVYIYTISIV